VPDADVYADVSYPYGDGAPGTDEYWEGFKFWAQSRGRRLAARDEPLVLLPYPTDGGQRIHRS
jgi:hypothetical protein